MAMLQISKFLSKYMAHNAKRLFMIGVIFSAICLIFSKVPEIDGSFAGNLSTDSQFYKTQQKIESLFSKNSMIHLKVVPENITLNELLTGFRSLEKRIKDKYETSAVTSIAASEKFFYLENLDLNRSVLEQTEKLSRLPFLKHFISADQKSFLIEVRMPDRIKGKKFNADEFDRLIAEKIPGISNIKAISQFHIESEVAKYVQSDLVIFVSCILVVCLFLIIYSFGSFKVVIYTVFILFVSLSPIVLLLNIFEIKINIVTVLAFPVVLVLSLADMIHLLTGWQHSRSIERVINDYIFPSFLTSVAVAVEFLSLVNNDIENLREFGIVASIAIMVEFVVIFLYSPYLMPLLDVKERPKGNFLSRGADRLLKYKKGVSLCLVMGFIVSLFVIPTLKFRTSATSFLPQKSDLTKTHDEMNKEFHSVVGLTILIEPPLYPKIEGFNWDSTDVGKVTYSLSEKIRKERLVSSVYSVNEIIDYYYDKGMARDKWKEIGFENPLQSGNNFLIYSQVKDADDVVAKYPQFEALAEQYKNRAKISFFSPTLLFDKVDQTLARQLLVSIFFSSVSVMFIFYLLTNSIRNTLLALFANIMPVSFIAIIFYVFKFDLNLVTSLTSVICLGVVVDDTIHVLYRLCYKKEKDISELGDGMLTTTLILSLGFGALVFSSFEPTRIFGLISAVVFIIAVLSDLALLSFGVIKEEENVDVS